MSFITRIRKQKAVYWEKKPSADEFGQPEYLLPVEISCRWDDEVREIIGKDGTKVLTRSVVIVDRDMNVGDKLRFGELSTSDTEDASSGWEVIGFAKNPNLKAKEFLRTAYL